MNTVLVGDVVTYVQEYEVHTILVVTVVFYIQKREVNTILGDIIKHMSPDRVYEQHYSELQSVMAKTLNHLHDFSVLFSMVSYC